MWPPEFDAFATLRCNLWGTGGLGVVGGALTPPTVLRALIKELKQKTRPGAAFGVDLLLPQVGGSARKTNYDYTKGGYCTFSAGRGPQSGYIYSSVLTDLRFDLTGTLAELIDIVVEEGARLFVCAVGVPPPWVVEKL